MIEAIGGIDQLFNGLAVFLSVNIIFWFTWATHFIVKRILIYKQRKQRILFTTYFNLILSVLFALTFWYVILTTAMSSNLIDNTSFGALYIRPLILLEAVGTAINEKEKYRRERR